MILSCFNFNQLNNFFKECRFIKEHGGPEGPSGTVETGVDKPNGKGIGIVSDGQKLREKYEKPRAKFDKKSWGKLLNDHAKGSEFSMGQMGKVYREFTKLATRSGIEKGPEESGGEFQSRVIRNMQESLGNYGVPVDGKRSLKLLVALAIETEADTAFLTSEPVQRFFGQLPVNSLMRKQFIKDGMKRGYVELDNPKGVKSNERYHQGKEYGFDPNDPTYGSRRSKGEDRSAKDRRAAKELSPWG